MHDRMTSRGVAIATPTKFVRPLAPAFRLVLRGGPDVMAQVGDGLGLTLSSQACRAVVAGARAALWLGPDEQLLILPEAEGPALQAALATALVDLRHSMVDVSHRQGGYEVSGLHAAAMLNTGCPLDLDPYAFPIGMCTRTVFGKAEIVLWRIAPLTFRLEVWRSFAGYVTGLLAEAGREFGDVG
ncbi:sarcosine oxidase subunit gamma [soil metagenome]